MGIYCQREREREKERKITCTGPALNLTIPSTHETNATELNASHLTSEAFDVLYMT